MQEFSLKFGCAISIFAISFLGAATVSSIPQGVLRPMVLLLVVVMDIHIFRKKDFGAIPMTIFNMLGAYTGTRVAMKRGTAFIRGLFLFLLVILISKLACDMVRHA